MKPSRWILSKFLLQVRAAYGLPISNFQGVYSVEVASSMTWRTV